MPGGLSRSEKKNGPPLQICNFGFRPDGSSGAIPKLGFVRIREFRSHASACRHERAYGALPKWRRQSWTVRLFFGYLILLPSFTPKRRRLARCGSNRACCDKLSWKLSDLIYKSCNSLDNWLREKRPNNMSHKFKYYLPWACRFNYTETVRQSVGIYVEIIKYFLSPRWIIYNKSI